MSDSQMPDVLDLTAKIVSAHVAHNRVHTSALPARSGAGELMRNS